MILLTNHKIFLYKRSGDVFGRTALLRYRFNIVITRTTAKYEYFVFLRTRLSITYTSFAKKKNFPKISIIQRHNFPLQRSDIVRVSIFKNIKYGTKLILAFRFLGIKCTSVFTVCHVSSKMLLLITYVFIINEQKYNVC